MPRRFPPPWAVTKPTESFHGRSVDSAYFEDEAQPLGFGGLHLGIPPVFAQKPPPVTVRC
jgi:hypothetical protein